MAVFRIVPGKYTNLDAVSKVNSYILGNKKATTESVYAVGGYGIDYENNKMAEKQYAIVKQIWEKEDKRQVIHAVVSFDNVQENRISLSEIERLAYPIGKIISMGEFQVKWAIHIDTDNVHIHYMINSVNYCTGKKYRLNPYEQDIVRNQINRLIKPYTHQICYDMEELEK